MLVAFDLPTLSIEDKRRYTQFRNFLLDDGYTMLQFSVYVRPVTSFARMHTHTRRVREAVPPEGKVQVIFITEAQWQRSLVFFGPQYRATPPEGIPDQLQFW